jgi:hypothetical protein
MRNTYEATGKITTTGKMQINSIDRLNEFSKQYPNHNYVMVITVEEPASTQAQITYYEQYLIPIFQKALNESGDRMTLPEVDIYMRSLSPETVELKRIGGRKVQSLKEIRDLSTRQMSDFIEDLFRVGAMELGIIFDEKL